jgi:hypothetical protein
MREGDDEQRDRGVQEQSQEVTGRSLVAADLLGGVVGARRAGLAAGRARLGRGHRLRVTAPAGTCTGATIETYSTVVRRPPKAP